MNALPAHRPLVTRGRGLLLALAVALIAVGAIVVLIVHPWSAASAAESPTVWQQITSGIVDGKVPEQVALEAFAYDYQVAIPGVSVPAGRDGGDAPTSGSGVVRWVQASWAELTPDQQAVVNRFITPRPNDPVAVLAADNPQLDAYQAELMADLARLGPKLGIPTITQGLPGLRDVAITLSSEDAGNVLMETNAVSQAVTGHYSPCDVTIYPGAWSNQPLNGGAVSDTIHVLLTHEAIHCYQNVIWGSVAVAHTIPPWITEGTAEWLAGNDTGIVEPSLPSDWQGYFDNPEMALTDRSYDAVGYYALLDHLGRNLWSLMAPAWRAAAASGAPSDSFMGVLGGDGTDVRDAWAPSLLRRGDWADPWLAYGFGLAVADQVALHPISATGGGWTGALDSRSNSIDQVQSSDGEIVTVDTTGLVSAHDDSGNMVLSSQSERFCTVDSCVCKPGTLRAGEDLAEQQMRLPFVLAFNAPEGGSAYVVTGLKLDDECGKPAPSPSGSGPGSGGGSGSGSGGSGSGEAPCSAGCAGTTGDPHLTTTDQQRYDFQAAGEFVLLRSADGSVEIQGRQEPWPGSDHLSINSAVAARVGSHRIGIYVDGDLLDLRVDGALTKIGQALDLGSGGRIVPYALGYEVDFPDGTTMWALSVQEWGMSVQIRPSAALATSAVGILGRVPAGGLGVPALPDGSTLPVASDKHTGYVELYQTFASAWRVTAASSLFDYAAGASTATFTNAAFPNETTSVTLADLPASTLSAAQQACATISDPTLHDQCVFDVATTGQAGFSGAYQATQAFDAQGSVALGSPAPSVSAPPVVAPSPAAGVTELLPDIQGLAGQALGPDGTLYLSVQLPDNSYVVAAADPQAGRVEKQVVVGGGGPVAVAAGSVWLGEKLAAGTCTILRLDPASLATQATIPIPCFFGSPSFASLGQAIWFVDPTAMDINLGGAVLRQLDPATNQPTAVSAPITYGGGSLRAGTGSIFYDYSQDTLFMAPGDTAFHSLGPIELPVASTSRGVWNENSDVTNAVLTGPDGVVATVPIHGQLVGADDQAAYTSGGPGSSGTDNLWRNPIDGSAPVQVAIAVQVPTAGNTADLGYFDDSPLLFGQHAAVKIWLPRSRSDRANFALDLQWIALP